MSVNANTGIPSDDRLNTDAEMYLRNVSRSILLGCVTNTVNKYSAIRRRGTSGRGQMSSE